MCEADTVQYLRDLCQEKEYLDTLDGHTVIKTLLDQEIARVQCGGRPPGPGQDTPHVDIYNEKAVRLATKVLVPTKQHPKFNFVGKLLGPRGSSLKQLQASSMTKMAILGRGSMRNQEQEEQLRASADPKHAHLSEDLHVEISTFASPAEAHARLALALSEVRAYLIPDSNDQIRQQQMRDIKMIKMSTPGSTTTTTTTSSTAEGESACGEDSGHDSDVSSSPTPVLDTCHVPPCQQHHQQHQQQHQQQQTNSSRSIFSKMFSGHVGPGGHGGNGGHGGHGGHVFAGGHGGHVVQERHKRGPGPGLLPALYTGHCGEPPVKRCK